MNYLAESETKEREEIGIELPTIPPDSSYYICSAGRHLHTNTYTLAEPIPPLPHTMASAEHHIDAE